MYPRLKIDLAKYKHNVESVTALCGAHGISVMAVTKVFCGDQRLVDVLNATDVAYIADSRLDNLERIRTGKPKVLLRLPSVNEIERVVRIADISLNSEWTTLKALDGVAGSLQMKHGVVLMIDIGDLREGIYYKENVMEMVKGIIDLRHLTLSGLGTNLTCFGGIIPEENALKKLIDVKRMIEATLNVRIPLVSGGNSSHLHLLHKGHHMPDIDNLRIGEALILGRETAFGDPLEGMYQDVVTLEADLIEVKHKPSIPEGEVGMDAFGRKPHFENLGLMKRGILALGRQDVDYQELKPCDEHIRLIGSSSDHIIVDLTHTDADYSVGDRVDFTLTYGSLLRLMTSPYVRKTYVDKV